MNETTVSYPASANKSGQVSSSLEFDYGSEGCVFESRRVQVSEEQELNLGNFPEKRRL